MPGIDMNRDVHYKHASFRFFAEGERHVTREFSYDVLLMVFEGVLRFSENGEDVEVHAGEYYIQRRGLKQDGRIASDAPKYLYVSFLGEWAESGSILPMRGKFDVSYLRPTMERLDQISHRPQTRIYVECVREFYTILTRLYRATKTEDLSDKIAAYLSENYLKEITLEHLCERFNFSKNHIINVFKNGYGVTPVHYINDLRLTRAMYLLEVTSNTIESVAFESGYRDYSHFYRSFYRKNGLSPQAWREKIQKK